MFRTKNFKTFFSQDSKRHQRYRKKNDTSFSINFFENYVQLFFNLKNNVLLTAESISQNERKNFKKK